MKLHQETTHDGDEPSRRVTSDSAENVPNATRRDAQRDEPVTTTTIRRAKLKAGLGARRVTRRHSVQHPLIPPFFMFSMIFFIT